ncbi:unhealthy ribosome biogenesis protein 2 homolog isoform X2 [Dysidea avara]|uniref:unhealthy ribosome biogenesis protein 2 homolog isoform X2 n=1 Tax=Dysidea avara TaxID=196820 RepID=UPI0033200F79
MINWLKNDSLSVADRVKVACVIYKKNDPSKLLLPKWLSEQIVSLHNSKQQSPQKAYTQLWYLLAACLQDGQQPLLNYQLLLHVAKDEITCRSCAVDNVILCMRHFPETLYRRYDVLVDLLEPLISLVMISLNGDDDTSLINLLYDLLGKYLNCQRNHGNQKKVFRQFCDNLLWVSLQLRCLCVRLGIQSELLSLTNKLLASLFHKSHLTGYDSGLAPLAASTSYTRHLFESLSSSIASNQEDEVISSGLPHLYKLFLEHSRQATNVVKKNTEFRFFQWLLCQLGVTDGQSNVDVTTTVKMEAVHSCLCVLQELDVVEPALDLSSGGSQLKWLGMLAKGLISSSHGLSLEVVNCLSVIFTIHHSIIEPLLPSVLCELTDDMFMMKLIDIYAKLRQLKELLRMQLEAIKSSHHSTLTAVYSHPVVTHMGSHVRHLPAGQVTAIVEMLCTRLQASLPDDLNNDELPKRKKRRRLLTTDHSFYQITDLFCIVLDHIPLVGVDIDHMIHQQLYNDILQPLVTRLPTLPVHITHCTLLLTISCTRVMGHVHLLTSDVVTLNDVPSICEELSDDLSVLLLRQLASLYIKYGIVGDEQLTELVTFILQVPIVNESCWDRQWLNVKPDNTSVASWSLVITELPYLYSSCSTHHLRDVANVIVDVFTSSPDQNDDTNKMTFHTITDNFMRSSVFQEMSSLHATLLQCVFEQAKGHGRKLCEPIKKCLAALDKMFSSALNTMELSHKLTTALSNNEITCDERQLELWTTNTSSIIEVFRYLPIARLPADQLVLCSALAIVWLITTSKCSPTLESKCALLLAWLLRSVRDHPRSKKHLTDFPFHPLQEWLIVQLLHNHNNNSGVLWPVSVALLECAGSCDPSVMSLMMSLCTHPLPQYGIGSDKCNTIIGLANVCLNVVLKECHKTGLPQSFVDELTQFYVVVQQKIMKCYHKKLSLLLSTPSVVLVYVTASRHLPDSVVDVSVCNGLVDGVEHMLREDVGDITGDTKKQSSVIEVMRLANTRGYSPVAVWHTGSLLWRSMLSSGTSPDQLTLNKLSDFMSKLVASCSADDAKVIFESLLSDETSSQLLFIKQWQLIVTSKLTTEVRKVLNHCTSKLVCKTMEVLIIAQSSVVEHDAMSLVAKLLTICAEHDTRSVMLTLHSYFSSQHQCCVKWISSCVVILSVMLRYHLSTAISCASIVFTIIGKLLVGIVQVAHESSVAVDEVVMVANNLCRALELVSTEPKFTKFVPHVIASYIVQDFGAVADVVKETLLSGVYLLLRLCSEHETSFLNATLDESSRELFQSILSDYNKLHKYKGKV